MGLAILVTTSWTNNPSGGSIGGSSTGCSIIIIILFFRMNIVGPTLNALYTYGDTYAPKPRGNSLPTKDNRTWVAD